MKQKLGVLALAISMFASAGAANAAIFDYSYTYNSGTRISGSVTGDLIGDYVQAVSDITVFANGVSLSDRTFYLGGLLQDDGGFSNSGGRLSPTQSLNRFVFFDTPDLNEIQFTSFFDFDGNLSTGNFGSNSHYGQGFSVLAADRPVNSSFSLVARTSSDNGQIPEPATLALLGLGALGIFSQRKSAKSQNP